MLRVPIISVRVKTIKNILQDERRDEREALLAARGLVRVDSNSDDEQETEFGAAGGARIDPDNISVGLWFFFQTINNQRIGVFMFLLPTALWGSSATSTRSTKQCSSGPACRQQQSVAAYDSASSAMKFCWTIATK